MPTSRNNHIPVNGRGFVRFAVYFAPRSGSKLAEFGENWFDARKIERAALIASPKRYGFHATLKAPFHLKAQYSFTDLLDGVEQLAKVTLPVSVAAFSLKRINSFYALVPQTENDKLNALAFSCVKELDHFRVLPDKLELLRRQKTRLSPQQAEMLNKWGYPYVDKTFRFHMTLTDAVKKDQMLSLEMILDELTKDVRSEPVEIKDICLFGDPGQSKPFRLLERFALSGHQ